MRRIGKLPSVVRGLIENAARPTMTLRKSFPLLEQQACKTEQRTRCYRNKQTDSQSTASTCQAARRTMQSFFLSLPGYSYGHWQGLNGGASLSDARPSGMHSLPSTVLQLHVHAGDSQDVEAFSKLVLGAGKAEGLLCRSNPVSN